MKIHIFAMRWKDEIRRSSQLRTLLKLVLLTTTSFSSVLSCEDLLISNFETLRRDKWSRKTQQQLERQKKQKTKTKENEDVKGQICDFQNKRELLRDPH